MAKASDALAENSERKKAKPEKHGMCHETHERAKADAATGLPITDQGRALLLSARPWPSLGPRAYVGECMCRSSLVFDLIAKRKSN